MKGAKVFRALREREVRPQRESGTLQIWCCRATRGIYDGKGGVQNGMLNGAENGVESR